MDIFIDHEIVDNAEKISNFIRNTSKLKIQYNFEYKNCNYMCDLQDYSFRIIDYSNTTVVYKVEIDTIYMILEEKINDLSYFRYKSTDDKSACTKLYFKLNNDDKLYIDEIHNEERYFQLSILNNFFNLTFDDIKTTQECLSRINYDLYYSLEKEDMINILNIIYSKIKEISI